MSLKKLKRRLLSLNNEILIPAIISIISIILIEFWLKNIPAKWQFQYDAGVIYLKLCYAFTSAFIFYFVVIHLPRERRKVKSYTFLNNRILYLFTEIKRFLITIGDCSGTVLIEERLGHHYESIPKELIEIACQQLNPHQNLELANEGSLTFSNWFDYQNYKSNRIKRSIQEIIALNEVIDSELLNVLMLIDDSISQIDNMILRFPNLNNLHVISPFINWLAKNNEKLLPIFFEKYRVYKFNK